MKDLGVVRKVPIHWEEHIQVFGVSRCWNVHSSCDQAAKEHTMAYDKHLKDFTTMYDDEAIL